MKIDMRNLTLVEKSGSQICEPIAGLLHALHRVGQEADKGRYRPPNWPMVWLAGGFIRDRFLGLDPKDIDICCWNVECVDTVRLYLEKIGGVETARSQWHYKIDVLRTVFTSPEHTVKWFDFTCCAAAAYVTKNGLIDMLLHPDFEDDCRAMQLRLNAPRYPRSTLARAKRFFARGWRMSAEEQARLEAMAVAAHRPEIVLSSM